MKYQRTDLLKFFNRLAAVAALSLSSATAFAADDADIQNVDSTASDAPMVQSQADMGFDDVTRTLCQDVDILMIGDTDHTALSLRETLAEPKWAEALQECGVTHVFVEVPRAQQQNFNGFQNGTVDFGDFSTSYKAASFDFHKMGEAAYEQRLSYDLQMFTNITEQDVKLVAADHGNGSSEAMLCAMVSRASVNAMRNALTEEINRQYFDDFINNPDKPIEAIVPDEHMAAFEADLENIERSEKVKELSARSEEYCDDASKDKRMDDTLFANTVMGYVKPGEGKAVVFYGAKHMSNNSATSMDNILTANGYDIRRVDLADEKAQINYTNDQDKPDYIYTVQERLLTTPTALTLSSSLSLKPQAGSPQKSG